MEQAVGIYEETLGEQNDLTRKASNVLLGIKQRVDHQMLGMQQDQNGFPEIRNVEDAPPQKVVSTRSLLTHRPLPKKKKK